MKVVAVTQARLGSTRLPEKILKNIDGTTLLDLHLDRILESKKVDEIFVATTIAPEDIAVERIASQKKLRSFRGPVNDVLDRFYQAIKSENAEYVVRLTSDCPLIDGYLIDKIVEHTVKHSLDYCSNTLDPHYPDGQDIEVFTFAALKRAWEEASLPSEREHVTPFIWKNSTFNNGVLFKSENFDEGFNYGHLRMTVDEESDYEVIVRLVAELGTKATWLDYAELLQKTEAIRNLNKKINRNEGYSKSIKKE